MAIILVCKSSLSGYALIDKLCHIDGKPDDHSLYACSVQGKDKGKDKYPRNQCINKTETEDL